MKSISGLLICAAALIAFAGCTGTTVHPNVAQQIVPKSFTVAAVGEITSGDELWQTYAIESRRGLIAKLTENQVFTQVLDSTASPGANTLLVSGRLLDVDKGNAAARWIVGFGAGRAHVTAVFQITDA